MITTIIILSTLLLISILVNWNLLRKTEKGEDIILQQQKFIEKFQVIINFTDSELIKIDEKGTFKSDDEVGFFFKQIKSLQEILNQFKNYETKKTK